MNKEEKAAERIVMKVLDKEGEPLDFCDLVGLVLAGIAWRDKHPKKDTGCFHCCVLPRVDCPELVGKKRGARK